MKGRSLWQWVTSLEVAVVITSLLCVAILAGTLMKPEQSLPSVYGSWWFAALIAAFCVNLFLCTFKTLPSWLKFFGVFLIHTGIVVIVLGGLVGRIWGEKGNMGLNPRQRSGEFVDSQGVKRPLPFQLELESFVVEYYPPRLHLRPAGGRDEKWIEAVPGGTIGLGDLRLRVVDYFPTYERREEVLEAARAAASPAPEGGTEARAGPAVRLTVEHLGSHPSSDEYWLFSRVENRDRLASPDGAMEVAYSACADAAALEALTRPPEPPGPPRLEVAVDGVEGVRELLPVPGAALDLGGYSVQVERVVADYARRDDPKAAEPKNPAVRTVIRGPEGAEGRWTFALHPDFESMHRLQYPQVRLRYVHPAARGKTTYRIAEWPPGEFTLLVHKPSAVENRGRLEPGTRIEIEGRPLRFLFRESVADAVLRRREVSASDEPRNPVVKVAHPTEGGGEEIHLLQPTEQWSPFHGTGVEIRLSLPGEVKDFKSTLHVIDGGRTVMTETIEVNHPLRYGGYSFYQASYDRRRPGWTGLMVSSDPGGAPVYAGFGMVTFGLLWASYVYPLLKRRRSG